MEEDRMVAVVECGATKSDWRLLGADGLECRRLLAPGLNVSAMPIPEIAARLGDAFRTLEIQELDALYLYVAGIVTADIRAGIGAAVRACVAVPLLDIQSDLVAAARSVCGRQPGIVAILGTGSNTCFYDGQTVSQAVRSGGFILGDEGGGAVLGKRFLADYLKGLVPASLAGAFAAYRDASYEAIVEAVYRGPSPSAYLGALAPFLLAHREEPYVRGLLEDNFRDFITRALCRYDVRRYAVGVVGGFGYACRDIFTPLCEEAGIRIGRYVPEPIGGLLSYHAGNRNLSAHSR
ncbi:MAG: hypothetical protein J5871_04015 [Bacteroidales bacterium]|nr:hypothetical protein [Bacteroidales bacterium]